MGNHNLDCKSILQTNLFHIPTSHKTINMASSPEALSTISYVMGAMTAGGGIMGYAKTRSLPSIIAGCTVGLLYGLGGYRIQDRQPYGVELSLLASLVLGGSSIPRAIRLQKPVPILLSVLSAFGMLTYGSAWRNQA